MGTSSNTKPRTLAKKRKQRRKKQERIIAAGKAKK